MRLLCILKLSMVQPPLAAPADTNDDVTRKSDYVEYSCQVYVDAAAKCYCKSRSSTYGWGGSIEQILNQQPVSASDVQPRSSR